MSSLKRQTFQSALVMTGTAVLARILSMMAGIVLARLLDPIQFGLVSLCYIVLSVVSLLAPMGLGGALIKRQTDLERAPFHVFVAINVTGLFFFLLVFFGADLLTGLLRNPEVRPILPWMALLILIDAVGRVPEAMLEKEMSFRVISRISLIGEGIYTALAIGLAALGAGIWSLVIASLGRSFSGTLLAIIWYPGRKWFRPQPWNWGLMRELLGFGFPMVGSKGAYLFYLNFDNFVVGRVLGATALGYYAKAFSFTSSTVDNLNKTIGTVLFPSYAKIAHNPARLCQAYLRSLRMVAAGTIPLALSIFITAPVLVPSLLGQKWIPMVPILQALALMSVVKPMSATTASVFNSLGFPAHNMKAGIVVSVVMVAFIFLLLPQGTVGVAWAVVIAHVAGFAYNQYQMFRLLPEASRGMLPAIMPALGGSIIMIGGMYLTRVAMPVPASDVAGVIVLGCMAVAGVLLYALFMFTFQRPLVLEVRELLRPSAKQSLRESPTHQS